MSVYRVDPLAARLTPRGPKRVREFDIGFLPANGQFQISVPLYHKRTRDYADESGATVLDGLDRFVRYTSASGVNLWDNIVIYPMKSDLGPGSGSTVYSLGGLTTNDMTLVNSPTWGASGITFNGTNQYGWITDFLGAQTLTAFARLVATDSPTNPADWFGQFNFGAANARSWRLFQDGSASGDPTALARSSDGTANPGAAEVYTAAKVGIGSDTTFVAQWIDGGGRALWANKTSQSLTLNFGTAQTSRYDSASPLTFAAALNNGTPANFTAMTGITAGICNTAITTAQREKITDIINAL